MHLMHKLYVSTLPYLQNCVRNVELQTNKMRFRSGRGGCASAPRDDRYSDGDDDYRRYDSSDDARYKNSTSINP